LDVASKRERLERVTAEVRACRLCPLHEGRMNPVVGGGNLDSPLVLVGEAPGRKEDEQGKPFVGSAGKLLDSMLEGAGLERSKLFITNIVKCRPPKNRRPLSKEVRACSTHLETLLRTISPRVIAPMGNSSVGHFLRMFGLENAKIGDIHGSVFSVEASWGEVILFPLYHPAAVLYNRALEQELRDDFASLKGLLEG
jgi:uracil-DNA glycosylase family 4